MGHRAIRPTQRFIQVRVWTNSDGTSEGTSRLLTAISVAPPRMRLLTAPVGVALATIFLR